MKRTLSLLLALVMVASAATFTASAADDAKMPFRDVKSGKWFYDAVYSVWSLGIMGGVSDTEFNPNGALSRAMFVTILGRLAGAPETGYTPDTFPDTKKNTWYSPYVGWAMECGIVGGFDDGTFRPNANLTREQMAKAMSEYIKVMGINMPRDNKAPSVFSDEKKIASWAKEYVEVLRRSGIVNGDSDKRYNPKKNISRAEAATIILNLLDAEQKAWQGYYPNAEADGYAVFGASYLYWNGSIVQGGLGSDIEDNGGYPVLTAFPDKQAAIRSYDEANTIGVSTTVCEADLRTFPIVKVCFKYENGSNEALSGYFNVGNDQVGDRYIHETIDFTEGASDDGYRTATVDLSANTSAHPNINYELDMPHVLMTPNADNGKLMIRYIAFFKDQASADAFSSADAEDFLRNYFFYSGVELTEITAEEEKDIEDLIVKRINEIRNTKSAITPEEVKKSGHKCYFISSIHGDDKNDGLSEKTPWKSLSKLFNYKPGPNLYVPIPQPGDAVFLERGSEFYAEKHLNGCVVCLEGIDGVTYSAYGTGPKPVLSCALDVRDFDNVGDWKKTEYANIWVLDRRA